MVDEFQGAILQAGSGRRWNAIEQKARVQRSRRMALRENQGKPAGPVASNVPQQAMPNYIVCRSLRVGGEDKSSSAGFRRTLQKVNRPPS